MKLYIGIKLIWKRDKMSKKINTFDINTFSFTYAGVDEPSLIDVNFSVSYGEFITLCGRTGSGKSTLLRNLKTVLAPEGKHEGGIKFYGRNIFDVEHEEQARRIGFVLQDPENQIVTDKVWHELAFGLENLGISTHSIRIRVAEMATFFGISAWINKDISELSGGQKQLVNLAAVMAMNPDVLILDEPTASLDPIASDEFIDTLIKINKDIGTTVIISEHNLDGVMAVSNRVLVMEEGRIIIDDEPKRIGNLISSEDKEFMLSMPIPLQIYSSLESELTKVDSTPLTVREGRDWLTETFRSYTLKEYGIKNALSYQAEAGISLKDVRFKYKKNHEDVIKNLNLAIGKGRISTIVGGNGSGKSTLLRLIAGILKPYRGKISMSDLNSDSRVILLPQNPQALFVCDNVYDELHDVTNHKDKIDKVCDLMGLRKFVNRHPYDLSGGEQQRLAFAKVLLTGGDIYLLDEPTAGLDGMNRQQLGHILKQLAQDGKTIIMVSHDLDFAATYSDMCYLLFDGQIMSSGMPRDFFTDNAFYTTAANRMSRHIFTNAVTTEDVVELCRINLYENRD
jgi:energy-coupling factor transport system ATP-binding protein